MHLEFDSKGYVCCILYGCHTTNCIEYTEKVPTEPEAYSDIDDWANRAQTYAYYLDDEGNLAYDASKAVNEDETPIDVSGSYSKEERLTGSKWFDGRPIYKRTFECEISEKSTFTDAGVIDDFLDVVEITGTFLDTESSRWFSINAYYSDSYTKFVRINEFNNVQCYSKGNIGIMYVTVYYTKLTG